MATRARAEARAAIMTTVPFRERFVRVVARIVAWRFPPGGGLAPDPQQSLPIASFYTPRDEPSLTAARAGVRPTGQAQLSRRFRVVQTGVGRKGRTGVSQSSTVSMLLAVALALAAGSSLAQE